MTTLLKVKGNKYLGSNKCFDKVTTITLQCYSPIFRNNCEAVIQETILFASFVMGPPLDDFQLDGADIICKQTCQTTK